MEISADGSIFVACLPMGTTTVRLRKPDGTLRASKSFLATTAWTASFGTFRKNGQKLAPSVGNRIGSEFAVDASLVWPKMAVVGSGVDLSGRCVANSAFVVFIPRNGSGTIASGTTDSKGQLAVTMVGWTSGPRTTWTSSAIPQGVTRCGSRGRTAPDGARKR